MRSLKAQRPSPALAAVALAVAAVDVATVASAAGGWSLADVAVAVGLGTLLVGAPLLALGAALPPSTVTGLALGAEVGLAIRYGPLLNAPARSPLAVAAVLLVPLAGAAIGHLAKARERALGAVAGGFAVLGLLLAVLRVAPPLPAPTAKGPSVVLVTIDTLRRDRTSPYGGEVRTPALDALAARGAVFDDAVASAPQTGPSHLAILTGRRPLATGIVANGTDAGARPEALAAVLRDAGYATAAFVSGFPVSGRYGFSSGFEVFDDDFGALHGLHQLLPVRAWDAVVARNVPRERRGDATNARALAWLREATGPSFLWVHYYDPHGPYTPPAPYDTAYVAGPPKDGPVLPLPGYWPAKLRDVRDADWLRGQYDGEVAWSDHLLGELLADVPEDALVVVTADHGEALGEHDVWFDHGDDLFDPALRVPLFVAGPGVQVGRIACQTPSVDVAPTILDLLGVADPFAADRDGHSRKAALAGGACEDEDAFASTVAARTEDPPVDHALRRPSVKCVRHGAGGVSSFSLADDPGEATDRHGTGDEAACADLDRALAGAAGPAKASGDAATQHMLEALGYTDPK